jgi:hypothetical protein
MLLAKMTFEKSFFLFPTSSLQHFSLQQMLPVRKVCNPLTFFVSASKQLFQQMLFAVCPNQNLTQAVWLPRCTLRTLALPFVSAKLCLFLACRGK